MDTILTKKFREEKPFHAQLGKSAPQIVVLPTRRGGGYPRTNPPSIGMTVPVT